ncbi:MAG: phosphopentomutase [Oligoflexia bacterium]|nr:phosphopentomutase [Oligoflexia bacterium]
MSRYKRIFLTVLDSVGIGEMPDAADFGDKGGDTLGNILRNVKNPSLPNLEKMGLGCIRSLEGITCPTKTIAYYGKCAELAKGKDTTTGHWEMSGLEVTRPFPTFYDGFPEDFIQKFIAEAKVDGVLGNIPASGTEIIQTFGDEHTLSKKPIVYTSADSVFQIACHEEHFGLDRLYEICKVARTLCDDLGVARVIARPFIGSNGKYTRTKNRKDYSVALPDTTLMDHLLSASVKTISIGKVASIYSEQGFSEKIKASDNREIFSAILTQIQNLDSGFVFANLVDFDMLYGHRRNIQGYYDELAWFDQNIPLLFQNLKEDDLLLFTADHGNDPTFHGSDHTREYVPLLAYSIKSQKDGGGNLGIRQSFADIGQTILENFVPKKKLKIGKSFLQELI